MKAKAPALPLPRTVLFESAAGARPLERLRSLLTDPRFLTISILLLGSCIRLAHLSLIDLDRPFRQGGLFLEFSEQIAARGYQLPRRIPLYTDGGVPYAYPPLAFYLQAVLIHALGLPRIATGNALPFLVSVLTLPSFHLLARASGLGIGARLVALLAFATLPAAFSEHTEGGGLAEAFGTLSLIWLAIAMLWAHRRNSVLSYLAVGVCWAACVMSSPGSAFASVPTFGLFALTQLIRPGWTRRGRALGLLLLAGIVALAVSSPYWLSVARNHGIEIFLNSAGAQSSGDELERPLDRLISLDAFQLHGSAPSFLWSLAIFAGAVWTWFRRSWALLAWFALLISIPREGTWMAAIPAAILAGVGWSQVLAPPLRQLVSEYSSSTWRFALVGGLALLLGWNLVPGLREEGGRLLAGERDASHQVPAGGLSAMRWASEQTPERSRFVVLADEEEKEWFPHLARRTVINMPYGTEWDPTKAAKVNRLEGNLSKCGTTECVARLTLALGYEEVYLYIDRERAVKLKIGQNRPPEGSSTFTVLWTTDEAVVGRLDS